MNFPILDDKKSLSGGRCVPEICHLVNFTNPKPSDNDLWFLYVTEEECTRCLTWEPAAKRHGAKADLLNCLVANSGFTDVK